jgi:hypothetical protein
VARDYGGSYGGQPWHDAEPPHPARPPYSARTPYNGPPYNEPPYNEPSSNETSYGGPPYGGPPHGGSSHGGPSYGGSPRREPPQNPGAVARPRRIRALSVAALVLGCIGVLVFGIEAGVAMAPRKFTTAQQQQITSWEFGKRWRDLPAGQIFPTSVRYPAPEALDDDPALALSAQRVGIAGQDSCAAAVDPAAAEVLDRDGCAAMLRATYVDATDSYVVTVGAAVLPGTAKAATAARAINGAAASGGLGPAVHTVPFKGTPAAEFGNEQRQLSGVVSAGSYVVLYTVGYADSRPRQPVDRDSYADAEMTSAGAGVAHGVLSVLAAPVPSPGCPGVPGC